MNKRIFTLGTIISTSLGHGAFGAVPQSISYQGKLVVSSTNYQGTAYFKFVVGNAAGNVTYWSNDGTSVGGQIPVSGVELAVVNGLFAVGLGDTRIVNMVPVPSSTFANPDTRLRVWFSTQPNSGFQLLSPDQQLRSVPYAHVAATAETVALGSIGGASLQANSVDGSKIVDASVGSGDLASGSVTEPKLGNAAVSTRAILDSNVTNPKLADGAVSEGKIQNDAVTSAKIRDGQVTAADLADGSVSHPKIAPRSIGGDRLAVGTVTGTEIADGTVSAIDLALDATSLNRVSGGQMRMNGNQTVTGHQHLEGDGANGANLASSQQLHIQTGNGQPLWFQPFGGGNVVVGGPGGVRDLNVTGTLITQAEEIRSPGGTPFIDFSNDSTADFQARLILSSGDVMHLAGAHLHVFNPYNGIWRDVHARRFITHGADVAESFDILDDAQPGQVVAIDSKGNGKLRLSTLEYDDAVAGVVSGAGGIEPGVILSQKGTLAHGDTSVTVNGRVYCYCDASGGEIKPGDLLTTSAIAGHAMKASDKVRAIGATVGKALTGLKEGRGLVLVLVATR